MRTMPRFGCVAAAFGIVLACALPTIAASPARAADLLVTNQGADSVWRLSATDGRKRGEHRTGDSPHQIVSDPKQRFAIASDYGGLLTGNTLSVLDLQEGSPTRRIDLGTHVAPHDLHFLPDGDVLVTTEGSASVLRVNPARGDIERVFDVGGGIGHMLEVDDEGRTAWITKIAKGTVMRIDLATGHTVERVAGRGAEGIALRPGGEELWVANRDEGTITVHDPNTLAVRRRMTSKGFPLRIAFSSDGRQAFVVNARSAELQVFDAGNKLPLARVPLANASLQLHDTVFGVGAYPVGLAVDSARQRAYIAISGADRIAVVDTSSWKVLDYWVTGREPAAVILVP